MTQSTTDRIAAEQAAVAQAELRIAELEGKRKQALLDGDARALDAADAEINSARTGVSRGRERIELLEARLKDECEQARSAALDALEARAIKARETGEKLITTKYAQNARQMSAVLGQLTAIDEVITRANRELTKAGRASVASPNTVRCRPMQQVETVERRQLGTGNPEHPLHGKVHLGPNGGSILTATGERVDAYGDFDVPVRRTIPGVYPEPLQRSVQLPSVDPEATPFWPPHEALDHDAVLADLGLTDGKPGLVASLRAAIAPRAA